MDEATALAYFEAIDSEDWTEVLEIESFGDLGDNTEVATFASIKDRRMRKFKTTRDAGTMAIVCGLDMLDEGQLALVAAEKEDDDYAFKLVYNDEPSATYDPSIDYFGGMVLARPKNLGGVGDISKRTFSIGVNTAVYEDSTESEGVPTNLTLPSITGAAVQVGITLTALPGTWTGNPTSFLHQWQHDTSGNGTFTNVAVGGTSSTYVPVVGDILDSLRVQVTAVNQAGSSAAANSLGTIPIIAA